MEAFKPVIPDTAATNVTAEQAPSSDIRDSAFVLVQSLSKLVKEFSKDEEDVSLEEITPVETAVPPAVPDASAEVDNFRAPTEVDKPSKRVETVTDVTLPLEAKAFLDTIARYESRGYDIIVGEGMYGAPAKFTDFSKHPNVIGMRTIKGPSTAAGRYQFVYSTWKDLQKNYPGQFTDFTPATQDRAAWRYAQDVFKQKTGGDLTEALKAGNIQTVKRALKNIWIGFGLDPDVNGTYSKAFKRYQT